MEIYERSSEVAAAADEVFAFLANPANLPKYLPPIHAARSSGSERVHLDGETPDGDPIHSDGWYRVEEDARTMEWGADAARRYSGRLEVTEADAGSSRVSVRLEFGPASVEEEIQERSGEERDPLEEGLAATLESIRRQIEEGSGKVDQPPLSG